MSLAQLELNFDAAEQRQHLARVSGKLAGHIKHYMAVNEGSEFHMADLLAYVSQFVQVAPASADRVLRMLKQSGEVNYVVKNRRQSLYQSLPAGGRA